MSIGERLDGSLAWLAPVDDFLENRRVPIILLTLGLAIAGLPLLYWLRFDFNPMNLRSPKVESIATYLDLRRDPNVGANSINVLVPSTAAAEEATRIHGEILPMDITPRAKGYTGAWKRVPIGACR